MIGAWQLRAHSRHTRYIEPMEGTDFDVRRPDDPAIRLRARIRLAAVLRWLLANDIDTAQIDPVKPWQNGV